MKKEVDKMAWLVLEEFGTDPTDWNESGSISTYDGTNDDIDIAAVRDNTKSRYAKNHPDLTKNDSFYMEFKFTTAWGAGGTGNESALIGDFNKGETINRQNFFGVILKRTNQSYADGKNGEMGILVYYSDGVSDGTSFFRTGISGTEYLVKLWYNNETNVATLKTYTGTAFDTFASSVSLTLSTSKTFTTNDFGIGNLDDNAFPTSATCIFDYDDAKLLSYEGFRLLKAKVYKRVD